MLRTRVGYCGGTTPSPTYRKIGDHTESIELGFDPALLSYAALIDLVFKEHDPARRSPSRQYRSAIFTADEAQSAAAQARLRKRRDAGLDCFVDLEPLEEFFPAEHYHQKYRLRRHAELIETLQLTDESLINSTLAARLNGFVAAPTREQLDSIGVKSSKLEAIWRNLPWSRLALPRHAVSAAWSWDDIRKTRVTAKVHS